MKKTSGADKMAVVYARYSSHGQTEQSIEGQLAAAETYAKAKGYTIVHEYIDRAMTGRNDNRDEFQRMLSDTAKKQFSVIIVWKVDRFGRNREEITFNKYRCKKNGVRVEYVAESVPDSAEGVILESVLEGMAEYYSLQLSQNVRRGMLESAKKHKAIGGHIPLGFKVDSDNNYVIDEDTAPTVRMIFQLYAEGSTISEILSRLNSMGLKTAEGRAFGKCSLAVLLKNEKYIGTYKYKDLIDDPDAIPAIVDKDIFWQVQSMLKVNRRKPSRKWSYTDFLLTDKLFCGKCGSPMSGESGTSKSGRKFSYYGCAGRRKNRVCTKRPVRQDRIEEAVLRKMQTIIENDDLLNFIAEQTWAYYVEQNERQDRIRSIQAQIDTDEKAITNLLKVLERGIVSEATVARVEELENEKTALKAALADAQLESGLHVTKDSILFFLHQFKTLDYTDRDCQRRLIDTFVNAVFVYDDKIRIAFNWSGDSDTIALDDVDAAIDGGGEVFARCLPCPAKADTVEHLTWIRCVILLEMKMPER